MIEFNTKKRGEKSPAFFIRRHVSFVFLAMLLLLITNGCQKATYTEENIVSSMEKICREEYKVEDVEVKFNGKTMGIFLPLDRLFESDIRSAIISGKVKDFESLFAPRPEAMDKLENVLFVTSRVVLSTDKPIDFYQLYASDVESTGLQIVLTGYVDDIKRLRAWDISRDEYRKRILHDLKLNRAILWEKPVRGLFRDAKKKPAKDLAKLYLGVRPTQEALSPLFYNFWKTLDKKESVQIRIRQMKSHAYLDNKALVYAKIVEDYKPAKGVSLGDFLYPPNTELEYIFIVDLFGNDFKIAQVIPFYFIDEAKQLKKISFPQDLELYQNLDTWQERFEVEDIHLGDFLAAQLNRRIQASLTGEERVRTTIRKARLNLAYHNKPEEFENGGQKPYFSLTFDILTKDMRGMPPSLDSVLQNEDVQYILNEVVREFVDVIRSYHFQDYASLDLVWQPGGPATSFQLIPENLERFRRKKITISGLLSPSNT